MSLPSQIAPAILDMVIGPLATLFLAHANNNQTAAYQAASQMLSAHNAETSDELALAGEIVSLQIHTLKALSDGFDPDLPLNKVLRLRGGAVSLSRECHKARRRLDHLQRARLAGATAHSADAAQSQPSSPASTPVQFKPDTAPTPIEVARGANQTVQKSGGKNWSQSHQKQQAAKRIFNNLKKNQADHAISTAHRDEQPVGAPAENLTFLSRLLQAASAPGPLPLPV